MIVSQLLLQNAIIESEGRVGSYLHRASKKEYTENKEGKSFRFLIGGQSALEICTYRRKAAKSM